MSREIVLVSVQKICLLSQTEIEVHHKFFCSTVNCFQQVTDTVTQSFILSIHGSKFIHQTLICGGLSLDLLSESN